MSAGAAASQTGHGVPTAGRPCMPTLDLDLVDDLRRALYEESLVLHYQPEVELASGAIVGMEALLRWQHPGRGLLWPNEFLPVAEAAGLVSKIGWWVLAHA